MVSRFASLLRRPAARLPLAIILFGAVIVTFLMVDGILEARRDERATIDQARRDTANFAIAFREDVRRTISGIDDLMILVAGEYAADPEHYHLPEWLVRSPLLAGTTQQVALVGADGRVRETTLGGTAGGRGLDLSDRPHIRHHMTPDASQPYISVPVLGRVSGRWSIELTRRLERRDGSFAGVLVVSLDPFYLSQEFDNLDLGANGVLTLIGRDKIVRARRVRGGQGTIGQDLSGAPVFKHLMIADHGTFEATSPIDGVARIYGYSTVPDYPFVVVVGLGRDEVLARSLARADRGMAVRGGIAVLVILLLGLLLREAMRRLRREAAIAGQAALLTTILDVSPAAIWVKDESGRFELVNDAAAALLGGPKTDLLGRRTSELLPGETAARIAEWDDEAYRRPGTTVSGEHDASVAAETHRFLTFRRLCATGGRRLLVGSAVDVTPLRRAEEALRAEMREREMAEEKLRQAQKMEALGQLTGGIAHDFNNLLTTVLGNLELAARDEGDPARLRLLRNATRAARRGAHLVHHLLAFARRQELRPERLDFNALVDEAREILEHALGPTVRLETDLEPALWPALADANQVESALLNLALNARDAMPGGGCLLIRTANLAAGDPARPADLAPGGYVVAILSDTGTGMAEAVRERAFDPFFTTKEVGTGSGLGLSQVYGMARQSGGLVSLESRPGAGTTVRIYLPRAASAAAEEVAAAILVVDDDPQLRDFVALCLEEHGWRAVTAADGPAALRALDGGAVDLAVVGLAMPGMSSRDFVCQARRRRPELAFLLVTGRADAPVLAPSANVSVLCKPFGAGELVAEVEALLHRERRSAGGAMAPVPPLALTDEPGDGDAGQGVE